ncbi:hypothetical protein [Streptomyces sp. CC224B]|uniref:hypothetical protein n=1 Tax=Streptomyces sp. CC224B TaxID=3044571 RepID=UPI0024A7F5E2|nr:hypothetical protein [Streptomyces sp. CC224B]
MLGIIVAIGAVGFILAVAGQGGWPKLGGAVAGSVLVTLLLVPVVSTVALFLAVPAIGMAMGLLPPFDCETAPRAYVGWLVSVLLVAAGLGLRFAVQDPDGALVFVILFGPGACAAAGRLLYYVSCRDE